jgi:thiol-disulfide isomerase/thioredoxin
MFLILRLLSVAALAAVIGCSSSSSSAPPAAGIVPAADFKIEDYQGKVVLLNFWATWCPPCRVEIPDLVRLHEDFDHSKVAVIGVSLDNRGSAEQVQAQLKRAIDQFRISYTIVLDDRFELNRKYGGFGGIPTTFLIDQDGKVLKTYSGPRPYEVFAKDIQNLLDRG